MSALKKARVIWSKRAGGSKEAAHATKVLDVILARVSDPESSTGTTTTTTLNPTISTAQSRTNHGRRLAPTASSSLDKFPPGATTSPGDLRPRQTPPVQPGWMAVNFDSAPPPASPSQRRSGHHLDWFLGGDIDWVRPPLFLMSSLCLVYTTMYSHESRLVMHM